MAIRQTQIFWQQHVSQWQDSALSQAQYCKKHNLKPHSLSHHKRKQEAKRDIASSAGFIQLPVPQVLPAPSTLTLHFASGLSLSGIEPNNVVLVRQLASVLS